MGEKGFLNHLAGLRGLAIILVILFHMDGAAWSHGYLGVDVFLVITGYLLFRSRLAAPEPVSLRGASVFLGRKLQRIMPPMLVVIALTITIGILFLWWPDELFSGRLGYAACFGKANMMLKREFEDYFASNSAFIPLLHLWYLSVTLQVYLIFAVANLLLQRLPKAVLRSLLALIGIASLLYCYHAPLLEWLAELGVPLRSTGKPVSYYQTLPRLWEVMAGGLICILPSLGNKQRQASLLTALGLLLILLPALAGSLPGTAALAHLPCTLLVVAGSVLTLRYAPESHLRRVLDNKPLVWLGGISFSLYLVHMPIIVFMRMWTLGEPSVAYCGLMLLVSLAGGALFRYGIEKRRTPWWLTLALWGATLFYCREARRTEGFRATSPQSFWELPSYEDWQLCTDAELTRDMDPKRFPFFNGAFRFMNQLPRVPKGVRAPLLTMGDSSSKPMCVLIGDSHAAHDYAGLDSVLKQLGIPGVYLASYIYPLYGSKENKQTDNLNEIYLFQWLANHPEITHIIIGQRWGFRLQDNTNQNTDALRRFLQELKGLGKKVVIIGPTPEFGAQAPLFHYDKIYALRHISATEAENVAATCSREQYLTANTAAINILKQMSNEGYCTVIEPIHALAPGETFCTLSGRQLLMIDSHHLSAGLSIHIMKRLAKELRSALSPAKP